MELLTPVGRLVQGALKMQDRKDMDTNQVIIDPKTGKPEQGIFFSLAFPKVLPNGQANAEFAQLWATMQTAAKEAWPALFPGGQGPSDPRFSWKLQDGDGVDKKGKSVATKPGFAGHWIVKFDTNYPVRVFYEGKFAPHEEIQDPMAIVKRGYWVRVVGTVVSNRASGTQVPGIALYPNLISFVGGRKEEELTSGPDAQQAFGAAAVGWRPDGISAVPGAPVGVGIPGAVPGVPQVGVPGALPVPPAIGVPGVPSMPVMPPAGGLPGVPGVPPAVPQVPVIPVPPTAIPTPPVPTGPVYVVAPALAAQGVTMEGLLAQGWNHEAATAAGHMVRVS